MNKKLIPAVLLFALVVIFFVFKSQTQSSQPQTIPAVAQIAGTASAQLKGDPSLYPKADLTPGDVFPNVTTEQVCTSGYSSTVRDVPLSEKKEVYSEYGYSYPQATGAFEVDHFISLELGGSNDIKNLWPEPADPKPGFHEKDKVENYLHQQVCTGKETLQQAQGEIRGDWYAIYLQIK